MLQNYVPENFITELKQKEVQDALKHPISTIIGIMTGQKSDKSPVPIDRIKKQIEETHDQNFAGVSFFFYESFFNELSTSGVSPRDEAEVKKLSD